KPTGGPRHTEEPPRPPPPREPSEAKGSEPKPAEGAPKEGEIRPAAAPTSYTVVFTSAEPGVEVMVDGKKVGKTPDLKVPGLAMDKPHKVQAQKAGFVPVNLVVENSQKLETLEQSITLVKE